MPTYEYECTVCGHAFETMHGMTAPVLRKCPKCKKLKLKRLISGGAGVIFKGSGFYETDYKRNRRGADSAQHDSGRQLDQSADKDKSESKPEPKGDSKSETTSDTKTDSKSDSKPKKDSGAGKDSAAKKDSGPKKE